MPQTSCLRPLDPTLRRIDVADVGETVLADTVGFIRHLPHDLVAAFKATLQETRQATLLLHVIDAADVRVQENIDAVNVVLEEIDAHEIPTLLVMNKIDMLDDFEPRIDRDEENKPIRVWLSAQAGIGVPLLFRALTERLSGEVAQHTLRLPPQEGRLRSRFYQLQAIEKSGWRMTAAWGCRCVCRSLTGVASVNKNLRWRTISSDQKGKPEKFALA